MIGVPDDYRGEAAKAFVTLKAGAEPFTLDELRRSSPKGWAVTRCRAALEFREALPKTSVGKLSRRELRDEERRKYAERQTGNAAGVSSTRGS